MQTSFYHYQPSGDYIRDGPPSDSEPEDPQEIAIKTLHRLEEMSDDSISEEESTGASLALDLEPMAEDEEFQFENQPRLVWTLNKYKPEQVAQFIALVRNENMSIADGARKALINSSTAYKLHKEWKKNKGAILPGYKPVSEVKRNGRNTKLSDEHSEFLAQYIEDNRTCFVKDATDALCEVFEDLSISKSAVHRHFTQKLSFTLTRSRPLTAARNSKDTLEARRQLVQYLLERNIDFLDNCVFVDESGFVKNMVRPVA